LTFYISIMCRENQNKQFNYQVLLVVNVQVLSWYRDHYYEWKMCNYWKQPAVKWLNVFILRLMYNIEYTILNNSIKKL